MNLVSRIVTIAFACLFAAACANTRGELDMTVGDLPNPDSSVVVKIVEVVDARGFELKPGTPSIPSLQNGEIDNQEITKRAIARKRNGWGAALGDILLPEGRTVAMVAEEALAKALKESGYRVVQAGEPDYNKAIPLRAEVQKFWSWFTPGFAAITLTHHSEIKLDENWPVEGQHRSVSGDATYSGMFAATAQWNEVFTKGLQDLVDNTKKTLKKPSS